MLCFRVIGPGRNGNFLTGYFRPETRVFVPMFDCNTRDQAEQARQQLEIDAVARQRACRALAMAQDERRTIAEFYNQP